MKSLFLKLFDWYILAAPYIIILLAAGSTIASMYATTLHLALFNAFTACVNGLCLYYLQTRDRI